MPNFCLLLCRVSLTAVPTQTSQNHTPEIKMLQMASSIAQNTQNTSLYTRRQYCNVSPKQGPHTHNQNAGSDFKHQSKYNFFETHVWCSAGLAKEALPTPSQNHIPEIKMPGIMCTQLRKCHGNQLCQQEPSAKAAVPTQTNQPPKPKIKMPGEVFPDRSEQCCFLRRGLWRPTCNIAFRDE